MDNLYRPLPGEDEEGEGDGGGKGAGRREGGEGGDALGAFVRTSSGHGDGDDDGNDEDFRGSSGAGRTVGGKRKGLPDSAASDGTESGESAAVGTETEATELATGEQGGASGASRGGVIAVSSGEGAAEGEEVAGGAGIDAKRRKKNTTISAAEYRNATHMLALYLKNKVRILTQMYTLYTLTLTFRSRAYAPASHTHTHLHTD